MTKREGNSGVARPEGIRLRGTSEDMGRAFGRARRAGIGILYEKRLDNALRQARAFGVRDVSEGALLALARACGETTQRFDPEGFRELEGIAEGCGKSVEEVLAMNGLTDLRDVLAWGAPEGEGCTSVMVPSYASESGAAFAGQTWDLATDNAPHVLAVAREPVSEPRTYTVTTEGCLSLMGINAAGVAVGTTNLRTRDARPGVPYLSLIHRALRCESAEEAAQQIEGATRAGAHFFYLLDRSGAVFALECTGRRSRRLALTADPFVQCNHCQAPAHQSAEADTPERSSRARNLRMRELVAGRSARLQPDHLREAFADRVGDSLAICRDDFSGISTNAAVVLEPGANRLHACIGLPGQAPWFEWIGASAAFDVSN